MWAMIPMFRTRSSATRVSATAKSSLSSCLPAVMREGLVGLRHPVHVVLALERVALLLQRVQDLAGELVVHALLPPVARVRHEPAERQRAAAALRYLDGHLVVGAADAPGANLEHGRDRLHGLLEHLDGWAPRLLPHLVEGGVDDRLGDRLLAVAHHTVLELRDELALVDGIRGDRTRGDLGAARHQPWPFLAPYFERPCFRSATPAASSAARMTL